VRGNSGCATVDVFSTCPPPTGAGGGEYVQRVIDVARWSEETDCRGILVYADNGLVDPFPDYYSEHHRSVVAGRRQPVYMHPYTVAKIIACLGQVYGRRIYLNMVQEVSRTIWTR
jgi:alkanesulfonate monooxygenase